MKLGQPSKFERYRDELAQMMGEWVAKKEMARRTGLSVPTVRKYLKAIEKEQPAKQTKVRLYMEVRNNSKTA